MRTLRDTPGAVVEKGKVNFGTFRTPFRNLNLLDWDPFGLAGLTPKALRNMRLKEWQHFAIVTKTHFIGLAVVNAKFMGVSWAYAFDRETGDIVEHDRSLPLRGPAISRELYDARFAFKATGYEAVVHNHLEAGEHAVSFSAETKDRISLKGRLEIVQDPEAVQPLISVLPVYGRRVFYSHKVPCPVSGEFSIGEKTYTLDPATDFAILDVHKVFYPYRTWWKWSTFAGRDAKGNLIGVNLTQNIMDEHGNPNENAIWHGNRLSILASASFEIPEDVMQPWRITTTDGRADLTFTPQGLRQETTDLKVFVSWYKAVLGTFSGKLTDQDGKVHKVSDVFGISEHHRVTW